MEIIVSKEKALIDNHIRKTYGDFKKIRVDSIKSLKSSCTTNNLFNEKIVYIVKNDKKINEDILTFHLGENKLVLIYDKIDKRKSIFRKLKKNITEIEKPNASTLYDYVRNNTDYIEGNDILYFISLCNENIDNIINELHKINNYGETVNKQKLDKIILKQPEDRIFDLLDSLIKGQIKQSYNLLYELYELNESPIKIFYLLYMKVKQVLIVQELQNKSNKYIASNYSISNYIIYKTRELINYKSSEKLIETLKLIKDFDYKIKTGKIKDKTALEITLQYFIIK